MDVSLALLDSCCRRCCLDLAGMHQQSIFFKPEVISMDQHGNFDRDNDFKPATDFGFGPCFGQNHTPYGVDFSDFLNLDCSVIQKERPWHGPRYGSTSPKRLNMSPRML